MLEPLPDHQEMAGYAPAAWAYVTCTCLAYNIVNLTLKLNFEKLKPTIFFLTFTTE